MPEPLRPFELPVTEDDATIAAHLEHASIPALMASLVHITGDTGILDGPIRPNRAVMNEGQGFLSDEQKAAVREEALGILCAWRDAGCKLPPPPSPDTIRRMMSFVVGEPVSEDYVPMMLEEMALDGRDTRDVELDGIPEAVKGRFHVLVIGAGMSGLLAAIRLQEAGIPYTVVEKNDAVGGTWYENTYPGCRVDIGNHFYCYSFEPNYRWSEYFSRRDELHDYFERCTDKYGVRPHVRFRTEVVSARFDAPEGRWVVRLRSAGAGGGHSDETVTANAIVSAVGQLNRPKIPELPGLEDFRGDFWHSAQWRGDVPLEGRRVACIGTGASALQLVPEVARVAGKLTVFQRSPAWMGPNPNYHRKVSEGMKWCLEHLPYYGRWYRFLIFWPGSDGLLPSLVVDPDWPHPERSINELNEGMRKFFVDYIEKQVADPVLREKVTPRYPPFGKRMLQDNGSWLAALQRENVELVTERIERVTPSGIVTVDGREHPLDVIVFATGFHANRFLWPMDVVGKDGVRLGERWGDDPRAYLGITVPGFPNLFCLYGPATNLAHAGSIIFHSECQVRYVMGCLKALLEGGHRTLEVKPEVCEAFNRRLDERLAQMVWSHPGMDSWYKNRAGRVTTTSPWRLLDYWRWTKQPDLDDYLLS